MKKILILSTLLLALTSCIDTPKPKTVKQMVEDLGIDRVVNGTVGDGTSMHSLELITFQGDTLYYVYENNAKGGLAVGDTVNVIYKQADGELTAQWIVNLSALLHRWESHDDSGVFSFTFEEVGMFESEGFKENYTSWSIIGEDIYFECGDHTDKYAIDLLTEDSLVLFSLEDGTTLSFSRAD